MSTTRFTEDHEWLRLDGGIVTIGITDRVQRKLGDIVYVDLPEAGTTFEIGEPCATVESIKATSDICAPLDGIVTDRNEVLIDDPALVNRAPHDEGWFFKLRLTRPIDFDGLMDEAAYRAFVDRLATAP